MATTAVMLRVKAFIPFSSVESPVPPPTATMKGPEDRRRSMAPLNGSSARTRLPRNGRMPNTTMRKNAVNKPRAKLSAHSITMAVPVPCPGG